MYNKIGAAAVCAALLCGSAALAENSENNSVLTFSNELGSDTVNITSTGAAFAGMYDEAKADYTSEKVDAGVDAYITMAAGENGVPQNLGWKADKIDWYLTFHPVQNVSLGFSSNFWLSGSYLVVEDDTISGGRLGSDGFTFAYSGIPGLTLAVTFPCGTDEAGEYNWFVYEADGGTTYLNAGIGAEYVFGDKGVLGAVVKNAANGDSRSFGVYGALTAVSRLEVYAGYASRDDEGLCDVSGRNLINASFSYEAGPLVFQGDYITNMEDDAAFYAGMNIGYAVSGPVLVELGGTCNARYSDAASGTFVFKPDVKMTLGETGEFKIGIDVAFSAVEFAAVTIPVYWKYSF